MTSRRSLRREMRDARAALAGTIALPVRRALERALAGRLLAHLPGTGGILGCYAAVGDECSPEPAAQAARLAGWRLAFPRVAGAAPLSFHLAGPDGLRPGHRGIPEPDPGLPEARPDVVLVPLLAVDPSGHRLGQGGGHYDRTLATLRAAGPVLAIGIAWDMQIRPQVPVAPHDQPLDAIATPSRFYWTPAAPRWAP